MTHAPAPRLLALTHSETDPASRFRVLQYLDGFRRDGWSVDRWSPWPSILREPHAIGGVGDFVAHRLRWIWCRWHFPRAAGYDVVVVSRELPCLDGLLREHARSLVLDLDDAVHLGWAGPQLERMARAAAAVVVGNERLAAVARSWGAAVHVVPTVLDVARYETSVTRDMRGSLRLGWIGSHLSLEHTLGPFLEMFAALQRRLGFEFVIVSSRARTVPETTLRYTFVEWSPEVETRIGGIFDIGLMPLEDTEYNRAKCGTKILQYMAASLPWIASPVGVNADLAQPGAGILARTTAEWEVAVERLVRDPSERARRGAQGRAHVLREYDLERWSRVWRGILEDARLRASVPRR